MRAVPPRRSTLWPRSATPRSAPPHRPSARPRGARSVARWPPSPTPTRPARRRTIPPPSLGATGPRRPARSPPRATASLSAAHMRMLRKELPRLPLPSDKGGSKATATITADIADAPLVVTNTTISATAGIANSTPLATFTDPGGAEPVADYSATVNWGDGGTASATIRGPDANGVFTISGSPSYTAAGTPTVTITVHHDAVTPDAAVEDAAAVIGPVNYASPGGGVTVRVVNGSLQILSGSTIASSTPLADVTSLTVSGADGVANSFTLDYSGGTFVVPGGITFNGGALPATPSNSLTISGGSFDTDTLDFSTAHDGSIQLGTGGQVVNYTNMTPLVNTGTADKVVFTLPNGTVVASLEAGLTAGTIELVSGNGSFEITTLLAPSGSLTVNSGSGADTVTAAASFYNNFSGQLTVHGAANTLSVHAIPAGTLAATEGSALSRALATFSDPKGAGTAADYTATIDWGDGSSATTASVTGPDASGLFTISGSHTYAEASATAETASVVVHRANAIDVTVSDGVSVAEATLGAQGTTIAAAVAARFAQTIATFSDADKSANISDYSATIDWGDHSSLTTVSGSQLQAAGGGFNVPGSHTYADTGTFTIRVTVSDGGLASATATSVADVTSSVPFEAVDATYTIGSGAVSISDAKGLLAGDTAPSLLSVTPGTVTGAQGGSFVFKADGSFTYTPAAGFPGYDSAQFTVTDASGDTATHTVTVLSQHGGVVWKFYESVLNRLPDAAGLQYWTNYFNSGGSTGDMAFGFFESDELLDKVISNYYEQYLLRPLDSGGLTYWKGVWHSTVGPEQIKAGFADSPEFYHSAGGTPQSWITALYQRILDRTPDPACEGFWMNYYQRQTAAGVDAGVVRDHIALGFFTAVEAYGNDVAGWFQEYLFRAPTDAEKMQYVNQMLAGASDRTVEQAITNLPAYASNPATPAAGTGMPLADYYQTTAQTQAVVAAKDALFASL
ncbi:MAG: hypothetical protein B7X07_05880 [Actinobacteria bacterium 21-64-8]|nr:MAG: hypothetical protein B7X07_05880 [Actinobacteria bacterium 21-64-8]